MSAYFISLDSVDSTNSWAKEHIAQFDPSNTTYIQAQQQTAGRGQRNNTWMSSEGALFGSICEIQRMPALDYMQCAALIVRRVCENFGVSTQIKWPNDLYTSQGKLSGMLIESTAMQEQPWIIVGIGINVVDAPITDQPTASIHNLSQQRPTAHAVFTAIAAEWEQLPSLMKTNYAEQWRQACAWMIKSSYKNTIIKEILDDGRLVVIDQGQERKLTAL